MIIHTKEHVRNGIQLPPLLDLALAVVLNLILVLRLGRGNILHIEHGQMFQWMKHIIKKSEGEGGGKNNTFRGNIFCKVESI